MLAFLIFILGSLLLLYGVFCLPLSFIYSFIQQILNIYQVLCWALGEYSGE